MSPSNAPATASMARGWHLGATHMRCVCQSWPRRLARVVAHPSTEAHVNTACALVPWNAKALTPDAPGSDASALPHAKPLCSRLRCAHRSPWPRDDAMGKMRVRWGLIVRRCSTGDASARVRPEIKWIRPTTPAAGSVWPVYVLPACTHRGARQASVSPACISTARTAPISMGSPKGVPVPCMCRTLIACLDSVPR